MPHALYLRNQSRHYAEIDVFGDRLLNDPAHAAHSRTQSHDLIIGILADLASRHGIPTSAEHVPFADSQTQRRADLVTCRGGAGSPEPAAKLELSNPAGDGLQPWSHLHLLVRFQAKESRQHGE